MKTLLCLLAVAGAALAQDAASDPPVVVTAPRQTGASVTGLYKLVTGRTLIVASDVQTRDVALGPFTAPRSEAREILAAALKAQGLVVKPMSGSVDLLAQASAYEEPASAAPVPAIVSLPETEEALEEPETPEKPPATRVVCIEAELGAVSLGKRYESGFDFLAVLDDFQSSNSAGGVVAGSGVRGGFQAFQLAASSRPLSHYVKLLDSDSDYTSLARPRMQVLEGERGAIATGQRVAVPTQTLTTLNGGPASTSSNIQYEDVKLSLEITPEVRDDGRILLRIVQSDDSISGSQVISGNTVPTIASQTFSTTTLVRPLQTIALGGLKMERERKSSKGPRGLAKVPLLGRLFRVDGSEAQKSELVIFVTCWLAE